MKWERKIGWDGEGAILDRAIKDSVTKKVTDN